MFAGIKISSFNAARIILYNIYRIYKKYLGHKFHIYDLQTIDVIKKLPSNAVCIDVGANEGQILNFLYRQCYNGKIYVIEPIPDLIKYLQWKYNSNRVAFLQLALSDETSNAEFYYFPKRTAISGLCNKNPMQLNDANYTTLNVYVKKLDDIFNQCKLDFIKIDVEGAEYNVLKGAQHTLQKFKPVIIFESGVGGLEFYNHTPEDIFELLHSLSYKVSTLEYYLTNKLHLSKDEFIKSFMKGYDYQYIAYV